MNHNSHVLLSTGPLDGNLVNLAASHNIEIEVIEFIHTESIIPTKYKTLISELPARSRVIFTSVNAVTAVASLFSKAPDWDIYCMENATFDLVKETFGEEHVLGTAANADGLAQKIIQDNNTGDLIFFCGNLRRDELPQELKVNGIEIREVIVYETHLTPISVMRAYDGIIFYSPSGVESFFSMNTPVPAPLFFAIGNTTARAIKQFSDAEIIIASRANKKVLIDEMIAHYNNSI